MRRFNHAGLIHHRLGDGEKARDYLRRALSLKPGFSPPQVKEARRTLTALDR